MTACNVDAKVAPYKGVMRLEYLLFGLRTWLAMTLALYVAFWLQLEGASSSAVCVSILALQTRGQVYEKAIFRSLGTVVGVLVAIVISSVFNELRTPFLFAIAGWLGICVFVAGLCDGFRSYACVLSGYTVAIVAMPNIDTPNLTFANGLNRGAAIIVGIAATAVVNDLFGAPNVSRALKLKLEAVHRKVCSFAVKMIVSGRCDILEVVHLYQQITTLRSDADLLPMESIAGHSRSLSAKRAITSLVSELRAARVMAETLATMDEYRQTWGNKFEKAFAKPFSVESSLLRSDCAKTITSPNASSKQLIAALSAQVVLDCNSKTISALGDLDSGYRGTSAAKVRSYHSVKAAAQNGCRAFLAFLAASTFFVVTGWPATSSAMVVVAALAGLSATSPDIRVFAIGANIGMPLAVLVAGLTEFVILDGTDAFPLLSIALLPGVLVACFMMASGKPMALSVGFIFLVYLPQLISPTNPQSYNPQTYITISALSVLGTILIGVALATLLPTDDKQRRRWIISDVWGDFLSAATQHSTSGTSEAEASYRAADRMVQLARLTFSSDENRIACLEHALRIGEITSSIQLVCSHLQSIDGRLALEARSALIAFDALRLRALATRITDGNVDTPEEIDPAMRVTAAGIARTAALIDRHSNDVTIARCSAQI